MIDCVDRSPGGGLGAEWVGLPTDGLLLVGDGLAALRTHRAIVDRYHRGAASWTGHGQLDMADAWVNVFLLIGKQNR
ncbi:Nucleotide-binding protein, UspA family [Halanaeroarchaeum sp. HSR-CO]|nr:Nucleotide-binding protein, UspA family [Halanaeroarchaeum sp. HSR-CO]